MTDQITADQFDTAFDNVDSDLVTQVAKILKATGRYGDDADEVAADVLAALAMVNANQ